MSVWQKLAETYDKIKELPEANDLKTPNEYLLREGVCTNNANLEITIDLNGNFQNIELVPKSTKVTLIPCTSKSAKRTVDDSPHPLFEKLQYMAGDWASVIGGDNLDKFNHQHKLYSELLGRWAEDTKIDAVKAVHKFVSSVNLIETIFGKFSLKQLFATGVKSEDEEDTEDTEEQTEEENVEVMQQTNTKRQSLAEVRAELANEKTLRKFKDIFVRFKVLRRNEPCELWFDDNIYNEWCNNIAKYSKSDASMTVLSYISGEQEIADEDMTFPKKIRNRGDSAKILSANDETYVTFGDRFKPKKSSEPAPMGNKSMLHALYALSWLIQNQGFSADGLVVLTWNNTAKNIKESNPFLYSNSYFDEQEQSQANKKQKSDFYINSNKAVTALMRYGQKGKFLDHYTKDHKVYVLMLDGDSKGRIAIQYYNEFESERYYQMLEQWLKTCKWVYYLWDDEEKKFKPSINTPRFDAIFNVAYKDCIKGGGKSTAKFKNMFYKEILRCVLNGKVSKMLVQKAFCNVCNRSGFEAEKQKYSTQYQNWQNAIATTCAMLNSNLQLGEEYMELNLQETNRSYCFGRLLAVLEGIERKEVSDRATNAERLFAHYSKKPRTTFDALYKTCKIYLVKMKSDKSKVGLANYFDKQISDILKLIDEKDYNDNPLDAQFLVGYFLQKNYYKDDTDNNASEEIEVA